jgi:hypothetical protein
MLFMFQNKVEPKETHPVYMSVTDIAYDSNQKKFEMICRLFTNDLENVLKKYHTGVDLLDPSKKHTSSQWIDRYIKQNLTIKNDGETVDFDCIGYENEGDAILVYYQSVSIEKPKEITIQNTLMYDYKTEQMNIMHLEINKKRISRKLAYPDTIVKFEF